MIYCPTYKSIIKLRYMIKESIYIFEERIKYQATEKMNVGCRTNGCFCVVMSHVITGGPHITDGFCPHSARRHQFVCGNLSLVACTPRLTYIITRVSNFVSGSALSCTFLLFISFSSTPFFSGKRVTQTK